ncbi:Uma2 family endonuclease [Limnothrix sp. FACHB-881]|uniref:Uma2 family endonuclease n=1 Tax=Limnothrix sp. FACHB-881 TaxID=2692819 RepID=UPI00168246DC|nr:Uma2 family endonuclease [Limnothrix sp. FACHB-881]MBD2635489.1 Uma2 family endonuclease [Limnothrix sp. FACHB-881]
MTQVCTPIEPAIQPIQPEPPQSIALSQPYRFTVTEYQRIYEAGALAPDARTELIEGIIVKMSPIGFRHQACVSRLTRKFCALIQNRAIVSVQNSVVLGDSQPQPDLMLLQETENFYEDRSPTTAEVLLLIEVADSTLKSDREVKGPLYARSGIGEFWLVDLEHEKLEVYRDPSSEGYQTKFTLTAADRAACLAFPDESITLSDLFGNPAESSA